MLTVAAGKLNQRVTLQRKSVTRNALGEEVVSWVDIAEVWAQVEPLTGRKFFAAAQLQVNLEIVVRIRYRTGLGPDCRVVWRGKAYDIEGEPRDVDAARTLLEINCASGVHDGR